LRPIREHLVECRDGLVDLLTLELSQLQERLTQIVLQAGRFIDSEADPFHQRRLKGADRLFDRGPIASARPEKVEGDAEVVLGPSPCERRAFAAQFL
jgi:hypothetical protein